MSSTFYYALSLSNSTLTSIDWKTTIKANSLDKGLFASYPEGTNLVVYGYRTVITTIAPIIEVNVKS